MFTIEKRANDKSIKDLIITQFKSMESGESFLIGDETIDQLREDSYATTDLKSYKYSFCITIKKYIKPKKKAYVKIVAIGVRIFKL